MNPNRMTIEELKELKPSLSNPIKLACDDGTYRDSFERIDVIGFYHRSYINVLNSEGRATTTSSDILKHYPSFKKLKTPEEVIQKYVDEWVESSNKDTCRMTIEDIAQTLQSDTPESGELLNALMNLKVD